MMINREVAGLTMTGGGGGHTIRCHHFIIHQDREISVRSAFITMTTSVGTFHFISAPPAYQAHLTVIVVKMETRKVI